MVYAHMECILPQPISLGLVEAVQDSAVQSNGVDRGGYLFCVAAPCQTVQPLGSAVPKLG